MAQPVRKPRIRRNITVHPDIWAAVQVAARQQQRSASQLIEVLALEHCRSVGTWTEAEA